MKQPKDHTLPLFSPTSQLFETDSSLRLAEDDHRLLIHKGDCLDLLRTLPDESVQLVVTSPPYNIGKEYEKKRALNDYLALQKKVLAECVRVLSPKGSLCWQVGNFVNAGEIVPLDIPLYNVVAGEFGLQMRNRIVWHYGHGLHASRRFSGRYETISWFTKTADYLFNLDAVRVPQKYPNKKAFKGATKGKLSGHPDGKNPSDVWDIPNVKSNHIEKTGHPCQFPVELIERLVLALTDPGDLVLDPFIGTGTSALAALAHKRRAVGAELKPEYIEIAKQRLLAALEGSLLVRPLERPVHNPDGSTPYMPPKTLKIQME